MKRLLIVVVLSFYACSLHAATFKGYQCTDDCSGHKAGYEWAEDNQITDPDDCGGNSNSFIEGCMAYAEEYLDFYGDDDAFDEDEEVCEDYPEECEDN